MFYELKNLFFSVHLYSTEYKNVKKYELKTVLNSDPYLKHFPM